jgi:hypothetical protein
VVRNHESPPPHARVGFLTLGDHMSAKRAKDYKFFFCPNCQKQKPLDKRQIVGKFRIMCADCVEGRRTKPAAQKQAPRESHLRVVESDFVEIPVDIMERYTESLDAA